MALEKKWLRPSLIIFCENEPMYTDSVWNLGENYLYLTDDNRDPVQVTYSRIEYKQRMITGRMRSYHVADKRSFSTAWTNLPSRSKDSERKYISEHETTSSSSKYAAGQELKEWYETYTGDFWILLVYDGKQYNSTSNNVAASSESQIEKFQVFFEDFNYDIVKRGQFNDLWDVSVDLVEA